jgi:hypothetical protein
MGQVYYAAHRAASLLSGTSGTMFRRQSRVIRKQQRTSTGSTRRSRHRNWKKRDSNSRISARVEDALLHGHGHGFGTVADLQFGADVVDMISNRVLADLEHAGNFLVGQPL